MDRFFPIGTPGEPWGEEERREWFEARSVQRSYRDEVLAKVETLDSSFERFQYGSLPLDPDRYPLLAVKSLSENPKAPLSLIHI